MENGRHLFLAVVIAGLIILAVVEDTDAFGPQDFYITIPGTDAPDRPIHLELRNGESDSFTVYVVNVSDKYVNVSFKYTAESSDLKMTDIPEPTLLSPAGSADNLMYGTFKISAIDFSDNHESTKVDLAIFVTDIADKDSTVESHIIFDTTVKSTYDSLGMYNKFFGVIPNTLPEPFDSAAVSVIVTMAMGLLIAFLGCKYVIPWLVRIIARSTSEEEAQKFRKGIQWLIIPQVAIASFSVCLRIIDADPVVVSTIDGITYFVSVVVSAAIAWKIYSFAIQSIFRWIEKKNPETRWDYSVVPLFKTVGFIVILAVAVSLILAAFNLDLAQILLSAGIVSLGITLGAQNVLSQFFSGLTILISRPFREGDFLKINDKVYVVRKVRIMYTEFRNWGGDAIVTMPNNVISSATVSNMTKDDQVCRQYVYFSVAYGTDLEKAQEVIIEAARKCPLVFEDEKHSGPRTRVTNFLPSGVEIRLAVHTPTFDDTGLVAGQLRALVYEAFKENNIEIPYDRIQLYILSDRTEKA